MNLKTQSWAVLCPTENPYDSIPKVIEFLLALKEDNETEYDHYNNANDIEEAMLNWYVGLNTSLIIDYFMSPTEDDFAIILTYEEFLHHLANQEATFYEIY